MLLDIKVYKSYSGSNTCFLVEQTKNSIEVIEVHNGENETPIIYQSLTLDNRYIAVTGSNLDFPMSISCVSQIIR